MKPKQKQKIRFELTQAQCERLGIVFCKCGHPPNNHFDWDEGPCAHCDCKEYRQVLSVPGEYKGFLTTRERVRAVRS